MNQIAGIPYTQVRFDQNGQKLNDPVIAAGTTDLIVVSHGWNNDEPTAHELYNKLFSNFAAVTANDRAFAQRKVAILGVIWPSKKFDELMTHIEGTGKAAGGAKSLSPVDKNKAHEAMIEAIRRAAELFKDPGDQERLTKLKSLESLVDKLETDAAAQAILVETLRAVLDRGPETSAQIHQEDSSDVLFEGDPANIFANASKPAPASGVGGPAAATPGHQAGGAAGLAKFFSKAANAVTNLLNLTSYFEMKQRAGTVGKNGVAPLVDSLANRRLRIHLVGHSFGGRVVAAAAANSNAKLHSLSLLQAAFSHNGFSKKRQGFFRSVVDKKRVAGPIIVTHTKNDTAVGLSYPAASRISGDAAAAFGGADDKFGAIGSNGAQQMEDKEVSEAATTLLNVHKDYRFEPGRIHNLKSDTFIVNPTGGDAHGFVFVPQVAWAISRAMVA
jgi:predicted alpha/beta hydrolase family esterase